MRWVYICSIMPKCMLAATVECFCFSFIDLKGYSADVSPSKVSSKRNSYFDTDVQTSPGQHSKVRVMENQNTKRLSFLQKFEKGTH